jgi:hypothetical protein
MRYRAAVTASTFVAVLAAEPLPAAASSAYYTWAGIALVVTAVGSIVASALAYLGRKDSKAQSAQTAQTTEQVKQINKAVNNVPPGDPTLIELVRITNARVDDTNAQVALLGARFSDLDSAVRQVLNRSAHPSAHPSASTRERVDL